MYDAGQMFRERQVVLDWIGLTAGTGVSTALGLLSIPYTQMSVIVISFRQS